MEKRIAKNDERFLGFAPVPPRGWNSWDCFGASVTEAEVCANAEVMSEYLKEYGWEYVIVDIQWSEPTADSGAYHKFAGLCMDEYSRLIPAENRFPSSANGKGFKPLADYIHSLGLKFGIHIMRGIPRQAVHGGYGIKGTDRKAADIALNNICPWNSDMYGIDMSMPEGQIYYDSLLELYASWDVDFIKVDDIADSKIYGCHKEEIAAIRRAIDKTGREIVLSLSPGPASLETGAFLQKNANMWRLTDDFWDNWDLLKNMFDRCQKWAPFIRKGNWIDCDMLPMGKVRVRTAEGGTSKPGTRFTEAEQRTMMTLWSIVQSPLFYGGDLSGCSEKDLGMLRNKEVIQMHNTLCRSAEVYRDEEIIIWEARSEDSVYFGVFNIGEEEVDINPKELYPDKAEFRDLWKGSIHREIICLQSHDAVLLQLIGK